jgi:hypothetical protein
VNYKPHPTQEGVVIGDNGHHYPSVYTPDTGGWATNEAWDILDRIEPGIISVDVRGFLAGNIAGALEMVRWNGRHDN